MNGRNAAAAATPSAIFPVFLATAGLLVGTLVIGGHLGSLIRPLFVIGCGAVGWFAWRKGPAAHIYSALLLFAFAPFVRRYVDVSLGFDYLSLMLIGPLLAILVPGIDLLRPASPDLPRSNRIAPIVTVGFSVAYAVFLTILQGSWSDAASGVLKSVAPLVYGAALAIYGDRDEILEAATSAFAIILPLTGAYAMYQYVDPPEWDRLWMRYASIMSAGLPIPYGVRSFSTMPSPASYGTFTIVGLLLTLFLRRNLLSILIMLPAFMGVLLSQYRTGWIAFGAGILFCLMFKATRVKAAVVIASCIGLGLLALTIPPFSDVIGDRLATFSQGGQDGSAQERLQQYITLWASPDSSLFGIGYTTVDVGTAGAMPVDGMIIACWLSMGIPVGMLCLFAYFWTIGQAAVATISDRTVPAVVIGAFAIGELVQLPLSTIGNAELGMLFWSLIALTPASARLASASSARPMTAGHREPLRQPSWGQR